MEYIIFAHQIIPGSDEIMQFAPTLVECQRAAIEQRKELWEDDPQGEPHSATAIYRYILRSMNTVELVRVLNAEVSITDIASVDRCLVALVAD